MNPTIETPRVFPSDESFIICANKAGLEDLRNKIEYLLETNGESIQLSTPFNDFDYNTLHLSNPENPEEPQSFLTTCVILATLLTLAALILIGLGTVGSWLF